MSEFFAVVQMIHQGGRIDLRVPRVDLSAEPLLMTNGFRQVFRHVFTEAWRFEHDPLGITWLGLDLVLTGGHVFHCGDSALDRLEPESFVLVLSLSCAESLDVARDRAAAGRHEDAMSSSEAVDDLKLQLIGSPYETLFAKLEYDKPDLKLAFDQPPAEASKAAPFILAFYLFGLMTIHRIDRAQVALSLPTSPDGFDAHTVRRISELRVRITNVNRYFLTTNRSESAPVKRFCVTVARDIELRRRYVRQALLNRELERHLDNVSQLAQSEAAERSNRKLMFIALFGVPLGLFSALVAFSFGVDVVRSPTGVLGSLRFWMLVAASVLLPWAMYALVETVARKRQSGGHSGV